MFSGAYIILCVLFLIISTNGLEYRTPCKDSSALRCDNGGYCIHKHQWCNNNKDCPDGSDEKHCKINQDKTSGDCIEDIHFKCSDNSMCIPREGVCDGYSSCPDMSDEKDCPCENLSEDVGEIIYRSYVGQFLTQQKCWKIAVDSRQYLELEVTAKLGMKDCAEGNITVFNKSGIYSYSDEGSAEIFCPGFLTKTFKYFEDAFIRYRSNFYHSSTYVGDYIAIAYTKVDKLCMEEGTFHCSRISCILPQKQCDGHKDCENGLDENDCAFNATYLSNKKIKGIEWIKSQHNADWGWKDNTHRAVVALYLSQGATYNGSSREEELIAKQLELEASTYLLRHQTEKMSSSELSAYINALLVICHDPRNFYGFNFIALLKEMLGTSSEYSPPFPYLTLCNSGEHIPQAVVNRLFGLLENSPEHGLVLEVQALATMALSCIVSKEKNYTHLQQNITEALNDLKKEQKEDGSFGSEYSTALVLQALKAGNQENEKDWSPKCALKFLSERQQENGSFGDFLTTYLVLPLFNTKTLVDVGTVRCTNISRRPRDSDKVTNIKSKLGGKLTVKYSLYIGNDKDQIHSIITRTPENITVHELMLLAVNINPKYNFRTHEIKNKLYVYEISNIPNDPLSKKFWFIYKGVENRTDPFFEQSPDRIRIQDQDHIIMWYKTLHSV